jgi:acyl transferase domain-containing protein/glutamate-1-semialdehyde aminotransferase/acyl-CoA synthetase (AMP-forming)/AMP-acid ligase II/NRPS condensation-like uncharacterized protein
MAIETLAEMLAERKNNRNKGITFIKGEHDEHFISYKELYSRTLSFLHALQDRGLRPGDEAVFQIEDNETFVTAFWACLLGGLVPVPVTVGNNDEHRLKVFNILGKLMKPSLIISQKNLENLERFAVEKKIIERLKKMQKNTILLENLECTDKQGDIYRSSASDTAFIQFSSGSTGSPKGVVLTHKNLSINTRALQKGIKPGDDETYLSWMPLTHDMGLIAFHLVPLAAGWNQCLIPPQVFIRHPLLWLKKAAEHKVTVTSSPNFGYKHLLKFFNPGECEDLDLSCIRLIFNGAEPISVELCYEFLERLARFGLKKTVIFPGYGLAEASVAVAVAEPGTEIVPVYVERTSLNIGQKVIEKKRGSTGTAAFVEIGPSIENCSLGITDEQGQEVGDRIVGHIQVKGGNVTAGYYHDKEATAKIMTADQWLDTGDLGFMRNGRLVITGREKDIIFANGQNYYSHDLERLAETVKGIDATKIAAVGVFNDDLKEDEVLFFVVYRKKELDEFAGLANELKRTIHRQTGLKVHHVIPVKAIPKTTSGKVQRYKFALDYTRGTFRQVIDELNRLFLLQIEHISIPKEKEKPDREKILVLILKRLTETLGYIVTDLDRSLFAMGIDSLKVPQLQKSLEDTFNIDLPVSLALDYPTVNKMADYLFYKLHPREAEEADDQARFKRENINQTGPIAIIGMACRFPGGADNPGRFWENLINGVCSIGEIPVDRWDVEKYYDPSPETPGAPGKMKTRYGGFLHHIDRFDAAFFKITPLEARSMDPQQRLLLEICWEAVENAGLNIKQLQGSRTGCFVGISSADYIGRSTVSPGSIGSYTYTGSMQSTASGRLSYFFGFQGPTLSIDTACSSSLVAIDQAVLNLLDGRCDLALAGGVNIILSPNGHIGFSQLNALSRDGKCKSFDDSADGYGRSEGCGVVVLKSFSAAQRDGDNILALIAGTSVMHNGESSGLTVPNGVVQERLIREAMHNAHIKPDDVDYLETHGSGTKLGDPQEINALANVFKNRRQKNKLLIGSVKTNIGHTESAAGIAGIIKVVLALQEEKIPPHLHFKVPNRAVPWDKIPIKVADKVNQWKKSPKPRIAGVSSFGISGTNAHVILRETPGFENRRSEEKRPFHILTLSAHKEESLPTLAAEYSDYLSGTDENIEDICYTTNITRTLFNNRAAVLGKTGEEIIEKLSRYKKGAECAGVYALKGNKGWKDKPVFLFTGQGSQYPGMAGELYQSEPVFKEELDRCDALFSDYIGKSITRLLYRDNTRAGELSQAVYAQPAIFSLEYSLCRLWQSWGITPSLVLGHSIGEYAAACIAGVFTLEEAVKLVAIRGKLMHSVPRIGKMAGVLASEEKLMPLVSPYSASVSTAAVNGPESITLSGSKETMEIVIDKVKKARFFIEPLDISHPFHSILMEPYIEQLRNAIGGVTFSKPVIPIVSTITGNIVTDEMCYADYWSTHLRKTVRFYDAVKTVEETGGRIFVEIGGTATLSGLAAECVKNKNALFLPSLRKGSHPWKELSNSLAALYSTGLDINWEQFHGPYHRRKAVLPNYPFRRESYWLEYVPGNETPLVVPAEAPEKSPENKYETGTVEVNIPKPVPEKKSIHDIRAGLKEMITIISGHKPEDIGTDASFFSMGLDSLMLVQLRKKINKKYDLDISLNQLLTDLTTVETMAHFLMEHIEETETIKIPVDGETREGSILKRRPRPGPVKINLRTFKRAEDELTSPQKEFVEAFINRYNKRTCKSKTYLDENRPFFSHWLNTLNFRMTLKELQYPLVAERARGGYLWDINGNRYIDLALGYGVHYFGHCPAFVLEAIAGQSQKGFVLSPHSGKIGETAKLICELTGVERVTFCNTGSEAVMFAIRLARTVTKRDKIVRFAGSYHGVYDGVLAEADDYGTFPSSPGITQGTVEDVIVLSYGSSDSLDRIKELGDQLAGVLVEPVQSRRPGFQPGVFLQELRKITAEIGAALIFDEMITGFRIHPGGAQHHFGIKADIVTYGKVIGGGMPIGIVAGKKEYLDAVDGGPWNYGDSSLPEKETAFIAGTFANHPLTVAAAHAVLSHIKARGPQLQESVNERTRCFAEHLNHFFEENKVPIRLKYFGPVFRFESFGTYDLALLPIEMDIFFYLLMEKGVYTWERRICFFSPAHTHENIQYVINAVKESIRELREGGFPFYDEPGQAAKRILDSSNYYPASPAQKGYFILQQMKVFEKATHLAIAMTLEGTLDREKFTWAWQEIINRHEVLRTSFEIYDGNVVQKIHDAVEFAVSYKKTPMDMDRDRVDELIETFIEPFDLSKPPLMRVCIAELSPGRFILVVDSHHIIMDGHSANVIFQELIILYRGEELPPLQMHYCDYMSRWQEYSNSSTFKTYEKSWVEKFSGDLPRLDLPVDFPRTVKSNYEGGMICSRIEKEKTRALKELARTSDATLFMVLSASYCILLHKLSGQEDIIVGIPVSTRGEQGADDTVGFLSNNLALRVHPGPDKTFRLFLREVKNDWLQSYLNRDYPYETLLETIELEKDLSRNPLFDVMFIYENGNDRVLKLGDMVCELYDLDLKFSVFDLTLEVIEIKGYLSIHLYYSTGLSKKETAEEWNACFQQVLEEILANPDMVIADILKGLKKREKTAKPASSVKGMEKNRTAAAVELPPANKIGEQLIEIWKKELNLDQVGINDNFFALGGRSFDTVRIISAVNRQLGTQLSLLALFEYPTVSELACHIETVSPQPGEKAAPTIPAAPPMDAYELSYAQVRYWSTVQLLSISEIPGMEVTGDIGIFEGNLDKKALENAVQQLAGKHDILRTTYDERNSSPVQIIHKDMSIPLEYHDLSCSPLDQQDERLVECLLKEFNRKFDLRTGPLIRFNLFKIHDSRHILFCNAPHISFDGLSFSIILEDLANFYNALIPGETGTVSSSRPARHYVDYVMWHNRRIRNGQLDRQADYWNKYIMEKMPVAQLPPDFEEGAAQPEPAKILKLKIRGACVEKLRELAAGDNTTLFVTVLAVLKIWTATLSNQTIITVGTVFSGRTYPELETIPGIMMNTMPLRSNLSGNPDCRQILRQTKQVVLEAYSNQDYPLELAAHKMRKIIDLNRDFYSIVFIGQESLGETVKFSGINSCFSPLSDFIGCKNDDDSDFLDFPYEMIHDFLIEMVEEKRQITLMVRYNHRKFRSQTVKRYFTHFITLLEQFPDSMGFRLSQLPPLEIDSFDELFASPGGMVSIPGEKEKFVEPGGSPG